MVGLFALLHDCRRQDDGHDRGHGERTAGCAETLARDGLLRRDPVLLDRPVAACAGHEHGKVSAGPTIGCCWDADRLELSRLGRRPVARLLSTDAARDPAVQAEDAAAWGL